MIVKIIFFVIFALANCRTQESSKKLDWWQTSVIYQIYPRSFKDSNDDGVGDLKGIEEQLNYFKELGVNVIWLSPIYESPMYDMGYDVANFTNIDPLFGTMSDFNSLLAKIKELDMKIIMDFIPNHSSDECVWFQKSINKVQPYTDYYVWKDPKGWTNNGTVPIPPNNWISVFQGSAWTFNQDRKQFFLHEFSVKQPDFNFRSKALVEEMKNVLRFWLDKGVDGFRVDSVMYLFEDTSFASEPIISNTVVNGLPEYYSLNHTYTTNQPETYRMAAEFRELVDTYSKTDGRTRILLTEAYTTLPKVLQYYGTPSQPIAQVPFNFMLISNLNFTSTAADFHSNISAWIQNMPQGNWPNWVLGNHDKPRVTSRYDSQMVDGLNMLLLLLPGTGITYQGEEIGMVDGKIRWDQTTDVFALTAGKEAYATVTRDPERTPFQWNSTLHAGFSRINGNTWLPVNSDYYYVNVETQKKDSRSHYNIYKSLLKLRQNNVIKNGHFNITIVSEWVLAFKRSLPGEEMYVVVLNLNNEEAYVNLNVSFPDLPPTMNVFIPSQNSEYKFGDKVDTSNVGFKMRPNSALVLQAIVKRETKAHFSRKSLGSKNCIPTGLVGLLISLSVSLTKFVF